MDLAMLDVAIGLILLYLLLSLVCSALVEAINHLLNRRGALLEVHLEQLMGKVSLDELGRLPDFASLCRPRAQGSGWVAKIWAWKVRMLARIGIGKRGRGSLISRFPSYVPKEAFADLALAWQARYNQSREWCDDHEFGRMLSALTREAGDLAQRRKRICEWFDRAMARASERFKARTQVWYALVAAALIVFANADSIRLANEIARNPAIQAALVSEAGDVLNNPALAPPTVDASPAAELTTPVTKPDANDTKRNAELRKALQQFPLLGWPEEGPEIGAAIRARPSILLGYLITLLALLMGADFWFSALRKLVHIRNAVKPEEKAPAAGGGGPGAPALGADRFLTLAAVAPQPVQAEAVAAAREPVPSDLAARAPVMARISAFAYVHADAADADAQFAPLASAGYRIGPRFADARTGTQALLLEHDSHRVLAFRGTEPAEFADIETDLRKKLIDFPAALGKAEAMRVHEGFAQALLSVWGDLLAAVRKDPKPVLVTGHSLGGALALLAAFALRMQEAPPRVSGVYTYGQPRVGDAAFAEAYDRLLRPVHWRVVNHRDLVPRLPPREMGFRHSGRVLYFDAKGEASLDPSRWMQVLELVPVDAGADWNSQVREFASDHAIDGYVRLLAAIEAR